jgi:hypothetical protein
MIPGKILVLQAMREGDYADCQFLHSPRLEFANMDEGLFGGMPAKVRHQCRVGLHGAARREPNK